MKTNSKRQTEEVMRSSTRTKNSCFKMPNRRFGWVIMAVVFFFTVATAQAAPGDLDLRFGAGGKVITDMPGDSYTQQIRVQPDGKIVTFSGQSIFFDSPDLVTYAARLNENGTRDSSFGTNGISPITSANFGFGTVYQAEMQPNGKILFLHRNFAGTKRIGRLNPNGTLDTTFGSDFIQQANGFLSINTKRVMKNTFAVQPDGSFVAAMTNDDSRGLTISTIKRYNINGYGTNLLAPLTPQGDRYFELNSIIIQPNGKIIAGGTRVSGAVRNFVLLRLNPNGAIDRNFGANGFADASFRGINDVLTALVFQPDGNLVALGDIAVSLTGAYDTGLARFLVNSRAQLPTQLDFFGDEKADFAVFRPAGALWRFLNSSNNLILELPWGLSTDRIAPADYDGDGRTDPAVFRDGTWYLYCCPPREYIETRFGQAGDVPVPADYDGDGRADLAVFRAGVWSIRHSSNNQVRVVQFGLPTDKPILGDFDGDRRADLAVNRDGMWFVQGSSVGFFARHFGLASDQPIANDYDADGKTDFAVFRAGVWYLLQSSAGFAAMQFGLPTDTPVPADYDGDGRADIAVFRAGFWYIHQSASNSFRAVQFGAPSDLPVPAVYLP